MGKANPKAWFTSSIARISYRKVDKWSLARKFSQPFFPTWGDAHAWMLARAADRLKKAQAELNSDTAHLEKVKAMKEPAPPPAQAGFASPLVLIWVAALTLVFIAVTLEPASPEAPPALAPPAPGASFAYALYVFIDEVTECQYLSTHNSTGLAPRIAPDGSSHMGCKGAQP